MKMTVTIKKRSPMWPLRWLLIFLPFCLGTLNDFLGLPYAIRYVLDLAWILQLFLFLCYRKRFATLRVGKLAQWAMLFFITTLAVFPVQYQSALYYLWGLRNNFRFYATFVGLAAFLKADEIEDSIKWFDILFWIDIAVSIVQHFRYGLRQDLLGGLFGNVSGVNGFANIFFLIILTKSILLYLEKKEKLWLLLLKTTAALFVAALAEMKFFFVEIILVIGLAVLFTNFTWRKLLVVIGGGVGVVVFTALLTTVFPHWGDWFMLEWFWETALSDVGYTGHGDLNRLTAITRINEMWLTEWPQRIFGMGLGNCETASYRILNTPFFRSHGHMHYTWISYAMIYLEMGYVGLVFYLGFFVLVYFGARRIEQHSTDNLRTYCRISRIMAIMCLVISVYNASLRAEAAYMAYFVMAIPFALERQQRGTRQRTL